jgi:plasmid stability protein
MASRNITFSLPADLIRQVKVYAAEHDTSISALVRQLLEEKITAEEREREAVRQILEIARRGPSSPVDPATISREEMHERW